MAKTWRIILLALLALSIAGCGGTTFGGLVENAISLDSQTVTQEIQYTYQGEEGPAYQVNLEVPADWVDSFRLTREPNAMTFSYVTESGRLAPVMQIYALSENQFWSQNGSYPSAYESLGVKSDTHFVYYLPREAYYSGLPRDLYQSLRETAEQVVDTFESQEVASMGLSSGYGYEYGANTGN